MPCKSKDHTKQLQRRWYKRNKKRVYNKTSRQREIRYNLAAEFKIKCIKCGIKDKRVLEFHHRNQREKRFTISVAIRRRFALADIIREIEKCDVVCRNCHAIIHAETPMSTKKINLDPRERKERSQKKLSCDDGQPDSNSEILASES